MKGVKRVEEEKKGKRREEEEWEILGCAVRDFVVVGKVVPSLADCDSILFLFFLLIFIFHTLFIHVLNPYPPSLPPSLSNSSFLTPFIHHPIT